MRSARTLVVCIIFLSAFVLAQSASLPTIGQFLAPTVSPFLESAVASPQFAPAVDYVDDNVAYNHDGGSINVAAGQFSRGFQPELRTSYGKLPLAFEANQGQTDPDVKFFAHRGGYALYLTATDAVLSLHPSAKRAGANRAFLRMKLLDANAKVSVAGSDELPGKVNYFIGKDASKWRENIPTYSKVHYSLVYPGVDLVYYGHEGALEYDFVVSPGGDPGAIHMQFEGAVPVVDDRGDLILRTGQGDEVRFEKPVVYQEVVHQETDQHGVDSRRYIEGRFRVTANHEVSFQIGSYDKRRSLVIDPVLTYSTYLGGSGSDGAYGLFVDSTGNAYITGGTTSDDFPTTPGVFQTTLGGDNGNCTEEPLFQCGDVFVTKLNPTGTALLWSTYLGGLSSEVGFAIFVGSTGVYVGGQTSSTNFPVTAGAFQTVLPTGSTRGGFVTKLNLSGSQLLYSTYLSGSVKDKLHGLAVDSSGNAYVTGETQSSDFPTTSGAFQTTLAGSANAFVTKLNATGTALVYSTFLGGNAADAASSIVIDSSGDAYITGGATSQNFPRQNPIQATFGGGGTTCPAQHASICGDAFVTELNPTGSALLFSTYLGGNGEDSGLGIALDSAGNIYVSGGTDSKNFPTTAGVVQPTFGGGSDGCTNAGIACGDAFLTEINAARTAFVYSTYLGGSGDDIGGLGLVLDAAGNVHMAGLTGSTNFPVTANAVQATFGGGTSPCSPGLVCGDAFVTKFSLDASTLAFSTYLGGSGDDGAGNIAQDGAGNDYVVGVTSSLNFPVTAGVFQPSCHSCSGSSNAFVAELAIPFPAVTLSPTSVNFGDQTVGVSSSPIPVTLTNSGTDNLLITSIVDANGFSQTNNCPVAPTALTATEFCTINITFTPTSLGTANDTLTITDDAAGSPQTVALSGVGQAPAAPAVTLAPSTLTFTSQLTGTSSAAQAVTLTNSGTALLTITSIGITGANASEFAQTNSCLPPPYNTLVAGAHCTINVTFSPTAPGAATASVSVTDNATGSPQTVALTGTAQSILTTTCTSLTVVPGQTAIFTVDLTAVDGFAPSVALSCSGAPALATCTVPSPVTTPGQAKVTATTTRATGFLQSPFEHSNGNRVAGLVGLAGITGFAALVVLPGKRRVKPGRRLYGLIFLLCLLATVATLPSCGGGGGGVDPPGTAVGTYPLTVTGTFQLATGAPITETVSFNLVVK